MLNNKPNPFTVRAIAAVAVVIGVIATPLLLDPSISRPLMTAGHLVIALALTLLFVPLVRRLRADAVGMAASEKRAEQEHRKFEELFLQSPDGLMTIDVEGSILSVNDKLESMFGYTSEDLVGQCFEMLTPERFRGGHHDLHHSWRANPTRQLMDTGTEFWGQRKDGTEFPIDCALGPCRVDDIVGIATVRDITATKETQDTLAAYSERLERSNEQLESFALVAAHDMQEPLRKVELFAGRLLAASGDDLNERARDDLGRVQKSVRRMRTLVDDLLSYAKVSTGDVGFEPVDLEALACEVIDDIHGLIQETGGNVSVRHLPVIEADPVQMFQLLTNLIGNALKFHRPDVPPQVTVEGRIIDDNTNGGPPICRFTVRDSGIGFDEMQASTIFSMFRRLHGRSEYSGAGIGLAVCLRIVERHGGTITATSTPGEGSTFIVNLPIRRDSQTEDRLRN